VFVGSRTAEIAVSETAASAPLRAAIRDALEDPLEQLAHDVDLIRAALAGPDPEFALTLLVDVARELPSTFRNIERAVASMPVQGVAA
jgi:hypothetical protein